jgi:Ca-activated chloride channel family protein
VTAAPLTFSVLGYALRLADPRALRLLLVVAAVALLGALALARRRRALRRAAGALAPRVAPGAGLLRPAIRLAVAVAGLALLAVALARPQAGRRVEVTRRTGVDLAVVLDASRSMRARDVRPDRLGRARLELSALLDGLAGDRVAVVSFAGDAFVQCPLTTDLAAARLFLRAVEPEAMPRQGTALGAALLAAKGALGDAAPGTASRARVVLVVSDGEDHDGGVASAARALADAGIRIFALAVGTADGAPVPAGDPDRPDRLLTERGAPVVSRLDAAALQLLADLGDGDVYDLVRPDRGLAAFRLALDRLQRGDLEARAETSWEERYAWAAFPGFLLLLAALLVREGGARGARLQAPGPRPEASGARGGGP